MSTDWQIICGDAKKELALLKDESANLVLTSPPYFRQRDYGVAGQIGIEDSVDEYVKALRKVLVELKRVLSPTGSCFFVVGDTYQSQRLMLVPHRLAIAAADEGWIVRNDVIWNKLDPPPESPRNRWRSGHEHVLFMTRQSTKYKFNADTIRVPYSSATLRRWGNGQTYGGPKSSARKKPKDSRMRHGKGFKLNPKGCIPTDVWSLPAGDSSDQHYATFPEHLVRPIIEACSAKGELVLDPFAGVGTTGRVAVALGRRFLGIELNSEYVTIAKKSLAGTKSVTRKAN